MSDPQARLLLDLIKAYGDARDLSAEMSMRGLRNVHSDPDELFAEIELRLTRMTLLMRSTALAGIGYIWTASDGVQRVLDPAEVTVVLREEPKDLTEKWCLLIERPHPRHFWSCSKPDCAGHICTGAVPVFKEADHE